MLLEDLVDSFKRLVEFLLGYDPVAIEVHTGKIQKVQREGVANLPPADYDPRFAAIQIVSLDRRRKSQAKR